MGALAASPDSLSASLIRCLMRAQQKEAREEGRESANFERKRQKERKAPSPPTEGQAIEMTSSKGDAEDASGHGKYASQNVEMGVGPRTTRKDYCTYVLPPGKTTYAKTYVTSFFSLDET